MKQYDYLRIPEEDYKRAIFQARGQVTDILEPLRLYGQEPYVLGAIEEIMHVMEQFGQRVRGKDVIIKRPRRKI